MSQAQSALRDHFAHHDTIDADRDLVGEVRVCCFLLLFLVHFNCNHLTCNRHLDEIARLVDLEERHHVEYFFCAVLS